MSTLTNAPLCFLKSNFLPGTFVFILTSGELVVQHRSIEVVLYCSFLTSNRSSQLVHCGRHCGSKSTSSLSAEPLRTAHLYLRKATLPIRILLAQAHLVMLLHRTTNPDSRPCFRLLDLPVELQRMIFDYCYKPWSLQIIDNFWRVSKSQHFSLHNHCHNPDYRAAVLVGAPPVSLSLTCQQIHRETQASILKSYTGMLEIDTRSSHLGLPKLPQRLSGVYGMTTVLILDERSFVDLFFPRDFPVLKELTISCFPIFCPNNFSGRTAPLDDEGFQDWAKTYQRLLERKSRKRLLSSEFVTVLDTQAEQWALEESVFCYLAEDKTAIQVVRQRLRLPGDIADQMSDEDPMLHNEDKHVCSQFYRDTEAASNDVPA